MQDDVESSASPGESISFNQMLAVSSRLTTTELPELPVTRRALSLLGETPLADPACGRVDSEDVLCDDAANIPCGGVELGYEDLNGGSEDMDVGDVAVNCARWSSTTRRRLCKDWTSLQCMRLSRTGDENEGASDNKPVSCQFSERTGRKLTSSQLQPASRRSAELYHALSMNRMGFDGHISA